MMRAYLFFFSKWLGLGTVVLGIGCSSVAMRSPEPDRLPVNLDTADRIRVGSTHVEEARKILGEPRIKLPGGEPETEAWLYCDREKCSQPRLTLLVDLHTNTVKSVGVALREGDPEQNLDRALSRYPGRNLKFERYLYTYRDYFEALESFVDSKLGLVIGFDGDQKKVTAISRTVPPVKEPDAIRSDGGYPKVSKLPPRGTASER